MYDQNRILSVLAHFSAYIVHLWLFLQINIRQISLVIILPVIITLCHNSETMIMANTFKQFNGNIYCIYNLVWRYNQLDFHPLVVSAQLTHKA